MTMSPNRRGQKLSVTEAQVHDYLSQNPEFFEDHLDLLETLKLPHACGDAVSLITRQIDMLRSKNRELEHRVGEIVQIARDNDTLSQRSHELTMTLIGARGLEDLLDGLKWGLTQLFHMDFVAVRIVQPNIDECPVANLFLSSNEPTTAAFAKFIKLGQPSCGKPEPEQALLLYGNNGKDVASEALVPLCQAGLRGVLAIGSRDPNRFVSGMGVLFLMQLAEVLAVRLAALLVSEV